MAVGCRWRCVRGGRCDPTNRNTATTHSWHTSHLYRLNSIQHYAYATCNAKSKSVHIPYVALASSWCLAHANKHAHRCLPTPVLAPPPRRAARGEREPIGESAAACALASSSLRCLLSAAAVSCASDGLNCPVEAVAEGGGGLCRGFGGSAKRQRSCFARSSISRRCFAALPTANIRDACSSNRLSWTSALNLPDGSAARSLSEQRRRAHATCWSEAAIDLWDRGLIPADALAEVEFAASVRIAPAEHLPQLHL